ncbi:MmcQ/YjbR family DNA-binding protein [Actinoplanes sp. NPDC049668]|uniref:MmcQ/YjbR family DNA-binding protein n=1 Tax=unclassified Actinoplanes TaxID=2626549 RepID=UPI0033AA74D9
MVTADEARDIALSLPGAEQRGHFDVVDFRVRNKIFCTLPPEGDRMTIRLTPEEQAELLAERPSVFSAPANHWGRLGWTVVRLAGADAGQLRELVTDAWRRLAPKGLIDR